MFALTWTVMHVIDEASPLKPWLDGLDAQMRTGKTSAPPEAFDIVAPGCQKSIKTRGHSQIRPSRL